jgi:hypothetical protein
VEQRQIERRLAAIVATDVAEHNLLMGAVEEGALAQFKDHRRALVDPKTRNSRHDREDHRRWDAGGVRQCDRSRNAL